MLTGIEKEYKYLVSAEQFQVLLSKCYAKYSFFNHKLQANYYYDTEDNALHKSKTTVRIRQHSSDMKLQIKKFKKCNDGLISSVEHSEKIDELTSVLKIPSISNDLHFKGVLVTERKTFLFGKKAVFVLTEIYIWEFVITK